MRLWKTQLYTHLSLALQSKLPCSPVWWTIWPYQQPYLLKWGLRHGRCLCQELDTFFLVITSKISPGRSTKSRLGDSGSMISTRTLFLENGSRSVSTSVLSSCSLFLRKSASGRWGLKTAAWARLIHISTFDLLYIVLPNGSTVRLPSLSIWRLIEHDQTPVVLLIMHSMGHLWFDCRILVNQ